MSLWSYLTNTEDPDAQAAAVQRHHDELQADIARHRAAGDLPVQTLDFASQFDKNAGPAERSSFWSDLIHRNDGQESKPSIGTVIVDALILALIVGSAVLFWTFGGSLYVIKVWRDKDKLALGGIALAAGVLAAFLYHFVTKLVSDLNSVKDQSLSLFK